MAWQPLIGVQSRSRKFVTHQVDVNDDGLMRCSCESYIHSTVPKWCDHLGSSKVRVAHGAWKVKRRAARHSGPFVTRVHSGTSFSPRDVWYPPPVRLLDGPASIVYTSDVEALEEIAHAATAFLGNVYSIVAEKRLRGALAKFGLVA